MTPGDRAAHMALLTLREAVGDTRITNGDPAKFKRLVAEARDAENKAGVELKSVYAAVIKTLHESDSPLSEKVRQLSFAGDDLQLSDS